MEFSKEFYDKFYRLDAEASDDAIYMAEELFAGKECLIFSKIESTNKIYFSQCKIGEISRLNKAIFSDGNCVALFGEKNSVHILAIEKPFTISFLENIKKLAK